MIWKKFTIETTVEAEDLVAEYLEELGFPGAEIEDQLPLTEEEMKQMYVDVPLIPEEETEKANVSIYLDESYAPGQIRELQDKVADELERMRSYISVGSGTITVTADCVKNGSLPLITRDPSIGDAKIAPVDSTGA